MGNVFKFDAGEERYEIRIIMSFQTGHSNRIWNPDWIPAFAGMTKDNYENCHRYSNNFRAKNGIRVLYFSSRKIPRNHRKKEIYMKIAIDTQTILGQKTGFGFYVKNLIDNLSKIDPNNEYILLAPPTEKDFSTPQRFIWDQFKVPWQARENKADILHQPCFSAPIFYSGKIVITVHDLISMHFPKNLPLASRMFYSKWMPFSYRSADKIIAISEDTKKDIMVRLHIPEEKIKVIHSAVAPVFKVIEDEIYLKKIKDKYKTGDKFILDVGTLEPRKNLPFLVRAYHLALEKSQISHNLVLSGKKGWYYDDLFRLIKNLNLENKVIFTGYVAEEDLPGLYNAADLFVFPSLYEGFGFPPLEAMACGTPVISSNTSSLPEVVGSAGVLLPPENEQIWADKITEVILSPTLRRKMKENGLNQAKKFSWEETARKTIAVYQEVFKTK